jgi:hypothetical protein
LGKNKIIIFDEFYEALIKTKLVHVSGKSINAIFSLQVKKETLILVSAHNSLEFSTYLRSHFEDNIDIQINRSIPELFGFEPQAYEPSLELCSDLTTVKIKALQCIAEAAK